MCIFMLCFFFQTEDVIRDLLRSRGLGDVYKRQVSLTTTLMDSSNTGTSIFTGTDQAPLRPFFVAYQTDVPAIQAAMTCPFGETAMSIAAVRIPSSVSLKGGRSVPVGSFVYPVSLLMLKLADMPATSNGLAKLGNPIP